MNYGVGQSRMGATSQNKRTLVRIKNVANFKGLLDNRLVLTGVDLSNKPVRLSNLLINPKREQMTARFPLGSHRRSASLLTRENTGVCYFSDE